jgi:hypothetical protein
MHLKPTAGFQISTLIFEKKLWRRGLYQYLVLIINPKCSLTRKGYNGMPLHVMEQPPRFFALAYRASDACNDQ